MGGEVVFDKMQPDFLCLLDDLRELVNEPLHINSSFRSKRWNKSVGGSSKSQHLTGNAVDLHCDNSVLRAKIIKFALILGLTCGVSTNFIHIDNREGQIVFTY